MKLKEHYILGMLAVILGPMGQGVTEGEHYVVTKHILYPSLNIRVIRKEDELGGSSSIEIFTLRLHN
jgi:hypothetical protein